MKNVLDAVTVQFDGCVLRALLEWLPVISCTVSAGALRWYFLLLSRVMSLDVSATTGQKCVTLLQQIAHEMSARSSPYHLLLRTRCASLILLVAVCSLLVVKLYIDRFGMHLQVDTHKWIIRIMLLT